MLILTSLETRDPGRMLHHLPPSGRPLSTPPEQSWTLVVAITSSESSPAIDTPIGAELPSQLLTLFSQLWRPVCPATTTMGHGTTLYRSDWTIPDGHNPARDHSG